MSYSAAGQFRRRVSGLGDACPAACPQGFHSIDMLVAPGKPAQCTCGRDAPPPTLVASASSSMQYKWGIIAGVAIAGFIVYKVAF